MDHSPTPQWTYWGILALCVYRLINGLVVQTYYVPDEWFQGPEVAHRMVFGNGSEYTWEWMDEIRIRGVFHPLIISSVYWALKVTGLDSFSIFFAHAPRVQQALFAVMGDVAFWKVSLHISQSRAIANFALGCLLLNWYYSFVIVRTLSNSIETIAILVSLSYWFQLKSSAKTYVLACTFTLISILVRPTAIVFWSYFIVRQCFTFIRSRSSTSEILLSVKTFSFVLLSYSIVSIAIDSLFYKQFTFVPYNFIIFNIFKGTSSFYGTHHFLWYFFESYPAMIGTFLPFVLMGVLISNKYDLIQYILYILLIFSCISHKEMRFTLFTIPLSMIYCGYSLNWLWNRKGRRYFNVISPLLILTNGVAFVYFGMVHQRAPMDMIKFIQQEHAQLNINTIDILTECHSMPLYSFVHPIDVQIRTLDCSPIIAQASEGFTARSESNLFLDDPNEFIQQTYTRTNYPDMIVIFEKQYQTSVSLLESNGFVELKRFPYYSFDNKGNCLISLVNNNKS